MPVRIHTLTPWPTSTFPPAPASDLSPALRDGLQAYWPLEGPSAGGIWQDVTDQGHHLTSAQNPAPVPGKIGNALRLDSAQGQYLEQADSPLRVDADFTWAGWIYPTGDADQYILSKVQADKGALLSVVEGRVRFWVYGTGSQERLESQSITTQAWHFVCARHHSASNHLFLQVDDQEINTPLGFAIEDPGGRVAMGVNSGRGDGYWDGYLDEFGWWNRSLEAEECMALYNDGVGRTLSSTGAGQATSTPDRSATPTRTAKPTQTATPAQCTGAPPRLLNKGDWAEVSMDPPLPNRVRSAPGLSAELIGQVEPGEAVRVVDGPRCADGYTWWLVRSLTGLEGWSAEGDEEGYWFVIPPDVFTYDTTQYVATSSVALAQGQAYRITLSGTYSLWFAEQWTSYGVCWGATDLSPMFPSPLKVNGQVGADAYRFFALPNYSGNCENGELLSADATLSKVMLSLDGGRSYAIPTPVVEEVREDHTYIYEVTGEGYRLNVRLDDVPLDDNYGQILVIIEKID
jgi:hypothetical protein